MGIETTLKFRLQLHQQTTRKKKKLKWGIPCLTQSSTKRQQQPMEQMFNSVIRVDMMAFLLGKSKVVKEILEAEPTTRELLPARKE